MRERQIPLNDRWRVLLLNQFAAFRLRFGRDPLAGEPIFFDPESDTPQPVSQSACAAAHEELVDALEGICAPPAIIYAFNKTHLLVTDESLNCLSQAALQEWDAAINEYEKKIADESYAIEFCFAPPASFRDPPPSKYETFVANKLCLTALFAYQEGISSVSLEGTLLNAWLSLVCLRMKIASGSQDAFRSCLGTDMQEIRRLLEQMAQRLKCRPVGEPVRTRIDTINESRALPDTWLGRPPESREAAEHQMSESFKSIQRLLDECWDAGAPIEATERMLFRYWLRTSTLNYGECEEHFQTLDQHWGEVNASIDAYMEKYAAPLRLIR